MSHADFLKLFNIDHCSVDQDGVGEKLEKEEEEEDQNTGQNVNNHTRHNPFWEGLMHSDQRLDENQHHQDNGCYTRTDEGCRMTGDNLIGIGSYEFGDDDADDEDTGDLPWNAFCADDLNNDDVKNGEKNDLNREKDSKEHEEEVSNDDDDDDGPVSFHVNVDNQSSESSSEEEG
jgi:hypothetical protein